MSNSPKLNCLNKKLAGKQPSRTSRITNENQHSSAILNEPRQYLTMQINTSLNRGLGFDLNSARQGSRKFQYVRVCSSMFEYVREGVGNVWLGLYLMLLRHELGCIFIRIDINSRSIRHRLGSISSQILPQG